VTAEQIITDAASLSVSERLRVAQAIWDSLPDNAVPAPSSEIKSEFDRRMQNYRQNPESAMTLDELRRRLDGDRPNDH
jgi:putative addiction module component (TIGR02574 family)